MEAEFDGSRHYMEAELNRTRDDLDKMRDKFRRWDWVLAANANRSQQEVSVLWLRPLCRLQNSYTASQRANQDLEEKLHALVTFLLIGHLSEEWRVGMVAMGNRAVGRLPIKLKQTGNKVKRLSSACIILFILKPKGLLLLVMILIIDTFTT